MLKKEADIGAAKKTIFDQLAAENPHIEKGMMIFAASDIMPQNCLAVRKDLDSELKSALKKTLFDRENGEDRREALRRFGTQDCIEMNVNDYEYFYKLASQVGSDLKKYRYKNE